ncbi:MAG: PQQ-binding-like beta-propeller repeat protein [Pirellulaceae bacterium]|nr:PQQ-binding-like beta-propeller repeat protein [Pirellulaceae bacterium]
MSGRALIAGLLIVAAAGSAFAQVSSSGVIDADAARQMGMERLWFTQVGLDRGKGRLAGVYQHVSATQAHTVLEILHEGKRYVFSERERDAFGQPIGVEGARVKANELAAKIKGEAETAGVKDAPLPRIDTYVVPQITIYVSSQRGMVHAIDGETGRTLWAATVGKPLHTTSAPAASDTHVAVVNGSMLYVMRVEDGSVEWSRQVVGAPSAGPAISEEFVWVPMIGGQVEAYDVHKHKRPAAVYRSFGLPLVQPVVSLNSVAWPTDEGNLYVGFAHVQGMRFRVEAKDAINSAPAFLAPNKVFATSLDGYVYCVHEEKGHVLWRFTTGEPISHSPVALGDTVYAITDRGNMYAISVADAQERWVTAGIKKYLAGNDNRLYCVDTGGNLTVLDTKSGSRIGSLATSSLDLPILNVQTDRILIGNSQGMIQCLRDSAVYWPVVHYLTEPKKKSTQPAKPGPAFGPAPMPAGPPAGPDPFAAPPPAAVDPFAAPAAPPAAAPPPAAVDPFADPK